MKASKRSNNRYLRGLWLKAGLAVAATSVSLAYLSVSSSRGASIVGFTIVGTAGIVIGSFYYQKSKIRRLLQRPDPTRLISHFERLANRNPSQRASLIASAATVAALYDDTALAERCLARIEWRTEPPIVQAVSETARALICYAEGRFGDGLNAAKRAFQLGTASDRFPGMETARRAFEVYIALGEVFTGAATEGTRERLLEGRARLPLIGQLLAAWGLWAVAERAPQDRTIDGASAATFIATQAPHCPLLRKRPPSGQSSALC